MSTVATEIAKQITVTEITRLIRLVFTDDASDFARSFKSAVYAETKTAFNDEFFSKIFANAANSGAIDELVRTIISSSITNAFKAKKANFTAVGVVRSKIRDAMDELSVKPHKTANLWSELNAIVKPATIEPLKNDVNLIIEALNATPEMDISIKISERNIIEAVSDRILKKSIINAYEKVKTANNIDKSVRNSHSMLVESIIENAFGEAEGVTTESADEFEDAFDTDENVLKFRIERLRKDIRVGLANAFTKLIGAKPNHPCRPGYVNSLADEKVLIEMLTKEAFTALQNAAGDVSEIAIKNISALIAKNIDSIVKRYENTVIDTVKRLFTAECTTNGKVWNTQYMDNIREPLDRVVKENSKRICTAIASIVSRSICSSYGKKAIKNSLDGIKSIGPVHLRGLFCTIGRIVQDGQKDVKAPIASIIDTICTVIKKIYNEAYMMDEKRIAKLITEGVL